MIFVLQLGRSGMSSTSLLPHQEPFTLKSFMRNQHQSLSPAIRADKRFDALVKQEMREHQHLISSHNKEMQELRDALRLAMEKFQSLSEQSERDMKDFKTYTVCNLGLLKERILADRTLIDDQKKTMAALASELMGLHVIYSTKVDADKAQKELEAQIREATAIHLRSFQEFQRDTKAIIQALKEDFEKLKIETADKVDAVWKRGESNFNEARLERDRVLKEVRVYEKAMFIIEKKIENIYTLIERINKRSAQ
jgi:hypothetical protein